MLIVGLGVEDVNVAVFEVVPELDGDNTEGFEGCRFDNTVADAEAGVEAGEDNSAEVSSIDPKTTEAEMRMR